MAFTVDNANIVTDFDVKRFYLPVTITGKCPHCQKDWERDFLQEYLSYPTVGEWFTLNCSCNECDKDWELTVKLNLSIEIKE